MIIVQSPTLITAVIHVIDVVFYEPENLRWGGGETLVPPRLVVTSQRDGS